MGDLKKIVGVGVSNRLRVGRCFLNDSLHIFSNNVIIFQSVKFSLSFLSNYSMRSTLFQEKTKSKVSKSQGVCPTAQQYAGQYGNRDLRTAEGEKIVDCLTEENMP